MNSITTRDWSIRPDTARNASLRKAPSLLNPRRGRPTGHAHWSEQVVRKAFHRKFSTTRIIFPRECDRIVLAASKGAVIVTPEQMAIFGFLCRQHPGHIKTTEEICEVLWPDPDEMPDYWVDVFKHQLSRLREKLSYVGSELSIITVNTRGYYLERSGAEVIS
ncbi:MAG: helix-turn-helix domain-containing protein [Thalassospira sp.]|uniref:helix-turn-helix domain-containing protein n=1 Tax=Thalassospira sp. TaxID=1912094 RepID=UPI003A87EE12